MPIDQPTRRKTERGLAMAMALFSLTILLLCASSGLLIGASNVQAMRNFRGAGQVYYVAESAISEALQRINGAGVVHLQNDVVTPWSSIWGPPTHLFGPMAGFDYSVTVTADAANPANGGRLIALANGVEGERSMVVATVARSSVPSSAPGAIYLATDAPTVSTFWSSAFVIDGNDRNYTGGAGPGDPVPGIATRTDVNTQATLGSLAPAQAGEVRGRGYFLGPPLVPSVQTSPAAPSVAQMNRFIDDLLARPRPADYTAPTLTGSATFGTPEAPQISHFTGTDGLVVAGGGEVNGAGVMIVEGDLTSLGAFNFVGIVLVRGSFSVGTDATTPGGGTATVYGSVWTEGFELDVGGSALVAYSTQALAVANQVSGGDALPAPLRVIALADCGQLPPGVGGCP